MVAGDQLDDHALGDKLRKCRGGIRLDRLSEHNQCSRFQAAQPTFCVGILRSRQ